MFLLPLFRPSPFALALQRERGRASFRKQTTDHRNMMACNFFFLRISLLESLRYQAPIAPGRESSRLIKPHPLLPTSLESMGAPPDAKFDNALSTKVQLMLQLDALFPFAHQAPSTSRYQGAIELTTATVLDTPSRDTLGMFQPMFSLST